MAQQCFSTPAVDGTRTTLQARARVCCFLPTPHLHVGRCGAKRGKSSQVQTRLLRGRSPGRIGSKAEHCQAEEQASTSGRHCLDCGQELELISFPAEHGHSDKPPLLFLHGALHGAWCYAENFLPYFARRGYDAHAVSLRGHGASDFVPGAAGSFREHIQDLGSVVRSLGRPPILIAHSLGGIFAQRYLAEVIRSRELPRLAGVAFVAAPALPAMLSPSMQWLQQLEGMKHGLQIIWWMLAQPKSQQGLVQELFFSQDLPAAKFERYHQKIMEQRSILPVTGRELTDYKRDLDKALEGLRRQQEVPVLVSSAGSDRMLMRCQVEALAEMLGTEVVAIPDVGHDLMLDTRWHNAAEVIHNWAQKLAV